MKLYELNVAIEQAYMDSIDPETGEIIDTSLLDKLVIERDIKVENIGLLIKNIEAENEAIHEEERKLQKRRKTGENRSKRLREYLNHHLSGEPFKSPRIAISFRKSQSVNITDISKIPGQYLKYEDPTADKTAIKKAIKAGEVIFGAELVDNVTMNIK